MEYIIFLSIGSGYYIDGTIVDVVPFGMQLEVGDMTCFLPIRARSNNYSYQQMRTISIAKTHLIPLDLIPISGPSRQARINQRSNHKASKLINQMSKASEVMIKPRLDKIVQIDPLLFETDPLFHVRTTGLEIL